MPPVNTRWAKRVTQPLMALVVAVCAVAIAACGSSSNKPPANSRAASAVAYSQCMRQHGVSNFPDPTTSGHGVGFSITPSMGINPRAPAFRAAQQSCRHLLPGGQPSARASAQAKAQLLRTSECMRAHGITDFPDPQTGSPPSGGNFSAVEGVPGAFLAIPNSINPRAPAFTHAAAACGFGP